MKILTGISASPGISIERVFSYQDRFIAVPQYDIEEHEIEEEIERYKFAVKNAAEEIKDLKDNLREEEEHLQLLDSHLLMLYDPVFTEQVFDNVRSVLKNVEWVLFKQIGELIESLNNSQDSYLRERTLDFNDVSKRLMNHLLEREKSSILNIAEPSILVTPNLMPSEAILLKKSKVKGIVTEMGGTTSHTAILARSFGIPAVLGVSNITRQVIHGELLIVDGTEGRVIIHPDSETLELYRQKLSEYRKQKNLLHKLTRLPARTLDNRRIQLKANIEVVEELDYVRAVNADGIGLLRSEFLYLDDTMRNEEQQFSVYREVLTQMSGRPVTIRTLDLGGDKFSEEHNALQEENPLLGWRAIRFCLDRQEIFKNQLRALYRASVYGDLRIMFPMISSCEQLDAVFEFLEKVKQELRDEGIDFRENIQIGIMIEIPSAALIADALAQKADFFSIGTNDLIQYTIAVDRNNRKISDLYDSCHPGVLKLIKMVSDSAHAAGIPVAMCGEMAGDPLFTPLLIGLGLDELSMSPYSIPVVKNLTREISRSEAASRAEELLTLSSGPEVRERLKEWTEEVNGKCTS